LALAAEHDDPAGQTVHDAAACDELNVPAGQSMHVLADVPLNRPAVHERHMEEAAALK
jgi:hypothetical protein